MGKFQEFTNTINLFRILEISLIGVSGLIEIENKSLFFVSFFMRLTPHRTFIKYTIYVLFSAELSLKNIFVIPGYLA